jgi:hypothetical protein
MSITKSPNHMRRSEPGPAVIVVIGAEWPPSLNFLR